MDTVNSNSSNILVDRLRVIVFQALLELCGGESTPSSTSPAATLLLAGHNNNNNSNKQHYKEADSNNTTNNDWHNALEKVAFKSILLLDNQKEDVVNGKPWDVEVRAAPALFHRYASSSPPSSSATSNSKNKSWKICSNMGLQRHVSSPRELGDLLMFVVEQKLRQENTDDDDDDDGDIDPQQQDAGADGVLLLYDVRCCHASSNGFLYMMTPRRSQALRDAGRLPCPVPGCVQWCKGESGLWRHVQQQHMQENHAKATELAISQRIVNAIVPYNHMNNNIYPSAFLRPNEEETPDNSSSTTSNTTTTSNIPVVDDDDPWHCIKTGNLPAFLDCRRCLLFDVTSAVDDFGSTPLHWAAGGGHLDLVRYLIMERGCNANAPQIGGKRGFGGRTALHWAARNGRLSVVQYLVGIPVVNLEAATTDGTTAFCWAAWQGELDVMKCLHERGCNVQTVNRFDCNAALWAAQGPLQNNNHQVFEWLESVGCNLYQVNANGHGVLHKAAQRGKLDLCEWFVKRLFSSITVRNNTSIGLENDSDEYDDDDDNNDDYYAVATTVLELLRPDNDGCTPSDLAGMEGNYQDVALFLAAQEMKLVRQVLIRTTTTTVNNNTLQTMTTTTTTQKKKQQQHSYCWKPPSWLWEQGSTPTLTSYRDEELVWEAWAGVRRMRAAANEFLLANHSKNTIVVDGEASSLSVEDICI